MATKKIPATVLAIRFLRDETVSEDGAPVRRYRAGQVVTDLPPLAMLRWVRIGAADFTDAVPRRVAREPEHA